MPIPVNLPDDNYLLPNFPALDRELRTSINAMYVIYPIVWFVSGTQTTGVNKSYALPAQVDLGMLPTIVSVRLYAKTAPTGQDLIVDVNKGGVTLFTNQANRPKVLAGAQLGAVVIPDITNFTNDDLFTVDVDQVGSGVAGADLTISMIVKQKLVIA